MKHKKHTEMPKHVFVEDARTGEEHEALVNLLVFARLRAQDAGFWDMAEAIADAIDAAGPRRPLN